MPVDCVGFISFHYFLKGVSVPLGNGLVAFHDFRQCLSPDLVRGDAFSYDTGYFIGSLLQFRVKQEGKRV